MLSTFRTSSQLLALSCLLFGICAAQGATKLKVVTSFHPVYCFTVNVAGSLADVENLLPPGVGPHDYQFSPKDLRLLGQADVVIVNGLGVEDWLGRAILAASSQKAKTVVELAAGLKTELIEDEHGLNPAESDRKRKSAKEDHHDHKHGPNPHIWLDPQLAAHAVTNILKALQKADPSNAAGYAKNAEAYLERLTRLDVELKEGLASVQSASFVTFHNAFPYFVKRYNLKLVGVIEAVPDVSPSPRYLSSLGKIVRERKAKVIFTEPQFSPKLARQLAQDLSITVAELDTLETGTMTPTSYEDGMRRNLRTLQQNLR